MFSTGGDSRVARRLARRAAGRGGFTLTEVAIAIAVVAGLTAAIVVGVNRTSSSASDDASRYASEADGLRATLGAASAGFGDTSRLVQLEGASLSYGSPLTFDRWQASTVFSPSLSGEALTGDVSYQLASGLLPDGVSFDQVSGDLTVSPSSLSRLLVTETGASFDLGESTGALPNPGPDGRVNALAVQPDGKILIGGNFTSVDGVTRTSVARLYTDGTLDESFDAGALIPASASNINAIVVLSDGRIVVGGQFLASNGTRHLVRLNSDGSLDDTFTSPLTSSSTTVWALAIQTVSVNGTPTEKVLVGGASIPVTARRGIFRLESNGAFDTTFVGRADASSDIVRDIQVLPDGKIMLAGDFTRLRGASSYSTTNLGRMDANGNPDTSFPNPRVGTGSSDIVTSVLVLPAGHPNAGKILVSGRFSTAGTNNASVPSMALINADASVTTSLALPVYYANSNRRDTVLQPDGKVVMVNSGSAIRLNADMTADTTFAPSTPYNAFQGEFTSAAALPGGEVLLAGGFSPAQYYSLIRNNIIRVDASGEQDGSFGTPFQGLVGWHPAPNYNTHALEQPDGRILLAGDFLQVNGYSRTGVARLSSDGTLDGTFRDGLAGPDKPVAAATLYPGGKAVIGGLFTSFDGSARTGVVRLNSDGTVDSSFEADLSGPSVKVTAVAVQPDGKIIVGGSFTAADGTSRGSIARLNSDGSLDTGFAAGQTGADGDVASLLLLSDGKVVVGGSFTTINGTSRPGVARLLSDGTLDGTFDPGSGASGAVLALAGYADGSILVAGSFTAFDGASRGRIARLDANGALDTTFGDGLAGANGTVYAVAIQPDGRVLLGGDFTSVNDASRARVARLGTDGALDQGFDPGADRRVTSMSAQADGSILMSGLFLTVDGTPRNRVARLQEQLTSLPFTVELEAVSLSTGYKVSSGPLVFNAAN